MKPVLLFILAFIPALAQAVPKVEFELSEGKSLKLGVYELSLNSVRMNLSREPASVIYSESSPFYSSGDHYLISFVWPEEIVSTPEIRLINTDGSAVWKRKLSEIDVVNWKEQISAQKKRSRELEKKYSSFSSSDKLVSERLALGHWQASYGILGEDFVNFPLTKLEQTYRFCVIGEGHGLQLEFCSRPYRVKRLYGSYKLQFEKNSLKPQVKVNNERVNPLGVISSDKDEKLKVQVAFSNGSLLEVTSTPSALNSQPR